MEKNEKISVEKENVQHEEDYNKHILNYLSGKSIGDLKYLLKEFSEIQKESLMKEKEEEESQTLNDIIYKSPKELEKNGVCVRKLDLIETVYESFGKYVSYFQKRSIKDYANKSGRYKFSNGDTIGIFEYNEKIFPEPLHQGVMMEFNDKNISIAFDYELEPEKLPKNFAIIKLCNQVTYERISDAMDLLEHFEIKESNNRLLNILFNLSKPTAMVGQNTEVFSEFIAESKENSYSYNNNPLKFYNKNLNESQIDAIEFCLQTNELGLIHGPPGTGKTTTVVELILQAVDLGKKILVVAPSNIAVDNIAEKIINFKSEIDFDLCRIGHPARMLESIISISLNKKVEETAFMKGQKDLKKKLEKLRKELSGLKKYDNDKKKGIKDEMRVLQSDIKGAYRNSVFEVYSKSKVILATLVGAADFNLKEFLKRRNEEVFDMVIIDECAQGTEASCWISILQAKKLILAGDHLQLPPTIKSNDENKILSFTLFQRMIKMYQEKVSRLLNIQYRMNEKIMRFSSDSLYKGKLLAHDSVKNHLLSDFNKEEKNEDKNDDLNLCENSLVYIDTSNYRFFETTDVDSSSRYNIAEAKICKFMVDYLKKIKKIEEKFIGIITPYSAQVNFLRGIIPLDSYPDLEISTVDGFQGREKEIIILNLVRSNKNKEVGFLADKRRLNVAITRAKRMCVLICDSSTVKKDNFIKGLCEHFSNEAILVDVNTDIFDYKEIEDLQLECELLGEKNLKEKKKVEIEGEILRNKQKGEDKKEKKKRNKKRKNNNNDINKDNDKDIDIAENKFNEYFIENNANEIELPKEFMDKINTIVDDFISSEEYEKKLEGLNNQERRYVHSYCDEKDIIHESTGDKEKRILVLRKKINKQNIENNYKTINKGNNNNINNKNKDLIEINENPQNLINTTYTTPPVEVKKNSLLGSLPPNFAMHKYKNNNNKNQQKNQPEKKEKNQNQNQQKKSKKDTKKPEDDWDEIENMLDNFKEKDKNNCHLFNCGSSLGVKECVFCNMIFCIEHVRQPIHDCSYLKNMPNVNSEFYKNKINKKLDNLEKERTTKPKKKK